MSKEVIDATDGFLNPPLARMLGAKIALHFGLEEPDLWAEMHPDQLDSWDKYAISVQRIEGNIPTMAGRTFLGFPLEINPRLNNDTVQIRLGREVVAEIVNLAVVEVR